MQIVSAVTTCPRQGVDYLPITLASLRNAGFAPEIIRDETLAGSWPTLRRALAWLLERPAEALVVFQDDIKVARDCREWLETQLWPGHEQEVGVVSLYTASVNHLRDGWFTADDLPVWRPWGACALVFPRHSAEKLLADPTNRAFLCGSDTSIGTFCRRDNLRWWMHSPSMVEHIGAVSAVNPFDVKLDEHRTAGKWCRDVAELTTRTSCNKDSESATLRSPD